jgi:TolA-binding protein
MKTPQITAVFLSFMMVSGCVTTRTQLNERRTQQGAEVTDLSASEEKDHSVKPDGSQNQSSESISPAPVSSQYGLEEMKAELAKLSGKIEEMEQDKKTSQSSQAEEQQKLLNRIADLEKQLKEKEEKQTGPVLPEGKTAVQAAKDAIANSKLEEAIQYLDSFLKEHLSGKDVEEGTFLRGEVYFKLKEFKKAIIDYSKFPEKFSKSNFHSKALLKIAECFEALEMKEEAKAFYQDLFDKFPKTFEGKIAKKKLNGKSAKK